MNKTLKLNYNKNNIKNQHNTKNYRVACFLIYVLNCTLLMKNIDN